MNTPNLIHPRDGLRLSLNLLIDPTPARFAAPGDEGLLAEHDFLVQTTRPDLLPPLHGHTLLDFLDRP